MHLFILPESGYALVIWPDGRAIRARPNGWTVPPEQRLKHHA
jgi:hypothetical protein